MQIKSIKTKDSLCVYIGGKRDEKIISEWIKESVIGGIGYGSGCGGIPEECRRGGKNGENQSYLYSKRKIQP